MHRKRRGEFHHGVFAWAVGDTRAHGVGLRAVRGFAGRERPVPYDLRFIPFPLIPRSSFELLIHPNKPSHIQ